MRFASLLVAAAMLLPGNVAAQAVVFKACYAGACYPNLAQAEAALQRDPVFGGQFVRTSGPEGVVPVSPDNPVDIGYSVRNREPEVTYTTAYEMVGGRSASEVGCTPSTSPGRTRDCVDEATVISDTQQRYRTDVYAGCEFSSDSVVGSYSTPFTYIRSDQNLGGFGEISYDLSASAQKRWTFDVHCPNWEPGYLQHNELQIYKFVGFKCPSGYYAQTGYADGMAPPGTNFAQVHWPYVCWSGEYRRIQVWSLSAKPLGPCDCSPQQGDSVGRISPVNRREETDVDFSRPFTARIVFTELNA